MDMGRVCTEQGGGRERMGVGWGGAVHLCIEATREVVTPCQEPAKLL